jgi:outer membrane usher protein
MRKWRLTYIASLAVSVCMPISAQDTSSIISMPLQLEAVINDKPTGLIIPVIKREDGTLAIERVELEEIGVKTPGSESARDYIELQQAGFTHTYDEVRQRINLTLSQEQRLPRVIDVRGELPAQPPVSSGWGALLNYVAFTSSSTITNEWRLTPAITNLSADLRMFSPYGVVTQTGIIGNTPAYDLWKSDHASGLRLETTYSFADPNTQRMYRAGDLITGSLEWTRPMRMGGLQMQRNFALRPDIVTAALPSASGSAAVPSSVDVLVNGVRVLTQQVQEGPFRLTNLPISASNGDVQMVIRDATGRETRTALVLFSSERLLAPGMFDYTMEMGLARKFYSMRSNDYDNRLLFSGSSRYGLYDWMTLQNHAELGSGGGNLGAGIAMSIGRFGTITSAFSASRFGQSSGAQIYLSYAVLTSLGISFSASTQRTFKSYDDLPSATAMRWVKDAHKLDPFDAPVSSSSTYLFYTHPPKEIHRASIGSHVLGLGGHASLAFAQIAADPRDLMVTSPEQVRTLSRTISATYSRAIPFDGNFFVTAFGNVSGRKERGLFAGVSFPLGGRMQIGGGLQTVSNGSSGSANLGGNIFANKPLGLEIGSYGWSASATGGTTSMFAGSASYRSSFGIARVTTLNQNNIMNATAQFEGAVALIDGNIALGSRVDDAFVIVRTDAPDVVVRHENNPIGKTNLLGTMLVPNLRSYQRNKIDIDPMTLPADLITSRTQDIVAPAFRSGIALDFTKPQGKTPTLLIVTGPTGQFVEPGSKGILRANQTSFVVGFDGKAYVSLTDAGNEIEIDLGNRQCRAVVNRPKDASSHQEVPVTCE